MRCHRCTEQQSAGHEHHQTGADPGFLVRTELISSSRTLTDGGQGG